MKTNVKILLVVLIVMAVMVQCTKEKGKGGKDKVMNKEDTQRYYYLTYDEQVQAKESFNDFKNELLNKLQGIKDIHELKEYFVTYADWEPMIETTGIKVSVNEFIMALKEGEVIINEPKREKEDFYTAQIIADTKVNSEDRWVVNLQFIYNGFKKKWEIYIIEITEKP